MSFGKACKGGVKERKKMRRKTWKKRGKH